MPGFATRRHLIDAQWIPELEKEGLLRDVTRRIGGGATRTASLRLSRAAWERSDLATDHGLEWSAVPHGRHTLAYLPWDVLERDDVRAALPTVAIFNLVANPTPSAPTLVIHQALLLRAEDGGWIARHASSSSHRVVEEPLDVFLERSRAGASARCSGSTCWRSSATGTSSGLRPVADSTASPERDRRRALLAGLEHLARPAIADRHSQVDPAKAPRREERHRARRGGHAGAQADEAPQRRQLAGAVARRSGYSTTSSAAAPSKRTRRRRRSSSLTRSVAAASAARPSARSDSMPARRCAAGVAAD